MIHLTEYAARSGKCPIPSPTLSGFKADQAAVRSDKLGTKCIATRIVQTAELPTTLLGPEIRGIHVCMSHQHERVFRSA